MSALKVQEGAQIAIELKFLALAAICILYVIL
jgi:hypothetical protein